MSREVLVESARRSLGHARAGTVPLAERVGRVPAEHYYDRDRWELEMSRVFRRVPLVLGFSAELAAPHSYKAIEVAGTPVLMTRGTDGIVRAFVNMCSHRGAMVVEPGSGTGRRFACPYHAWNYDIEGTLVGIRDREDFGEVDASRLGLTPLPCAERAGAVFVLLDPDGDLDIDRHLCGYDEMLAELGLADCVYVGSQTVAGPNWKVAYDGYLDFYHLPILHKDTFGSELGNQAIYDAWGPHQRVSAPDPRLLALDGTPPEDWPFDLLTDGVWTIFPHTSIASFPVRLDNGSGPVDGSDGGRMYMVSTLYPGNDPDTSVTVQHFLSTFDLTDPLRRAIEAQQAFLLRVVRDEDYFTGDRVQRALKTGAKREVLFGRNEAGGQRFHRWVDDLVAAQNPAETNALFEAAEVVFQR